MSNFKTRNNHKTKHKELNINILRKKLVETVIKKGLNHQEKLKHSLRLDKLIFKQSLISTQ
ncbi:aspartyl-phosphate phosphatase Spo0E family protein [Peribacillus sp. NPDC096540]|uniref:aspartyl-phosphate phosphatase Spo0E family protein n=1 Tax=Peribacillus sp. NPDC096540 TaxID=3390612 RepID=UPI003D008BDE